MLPRPAVKENQHLSIAIIDLGERMRDFAWRKRRVTRMQAKGVVAHLHNELAADHTPQNHSS